MNLAGVFHFASKDGVMDERISCTVDELAEALAAVIQGAQTARDVTVSWNQLARETASYLNADRLPEPKTDTDDWIYE